MAKHRAVQHRAVLAAAERLIVDGEGQMPTITDVAAEVGLARSSIYLYATSRTDLLIQLLIMAIDEWITELSDLMSNAGDDPGDRLAVYVDATLRLFLGGSHGPLITAAQQYPEAYADERVQASHAEMEPTLHKLLGGISPASLPLIDAAIQRGAELVAHSEADLEAVSRMLQRMARASLDEEPEG
ncbi:TetR/AcrR family transcriptional regulator [Corynebacterium hylobatis]|uniref:TetR/AcrR family transcriptional regulator n=1 Tax=Corynebacterium hylobatis TaxID=1859290 RepID=UPI001F49353D|nr:TetR/AcrR family transcriptional regulator [Corynebacterium hylobatis]